MSVNQRCRPPRSSRSASDQHPSTQPTRSASAFPTTRSPSGLFGTASFTFWRSGPTRSWKCWPVCSGTASTRRTGTPWGPPCNRCSQASVGVLKISLAFSSVDCRTQFACADVRPLTGYVQFLNTLPLSCSQLETFLVFWKQVANLNPKDNTYSLKDFVFRDVRRDWPGYSEDEKIQVERILTR